ncbi:hypothetical protein [Streptomyces tauricus]|uniref:hypothetical protein n=1 Tax=Streptomyces tauricus TaxID=68274 RepID=UPI00343CF6CC
MGEATEVEITNARVTALIAVTICLLGVAACGGTDTEGEGGVSAPTKAQLTQAALTQGDLTGYTVKDNSDAQSETSARAAKEDCQPIVNAMNPETIAYDERIVRRSVAETKQPEASFLIALSSVKSKEKANQAVSDLRTALSDSTCLTGFDSILSGESFNIRRVLTNATVKDAVDFSIEAKNGMKVRYVFLAQGSALLRILAADPSFNHFVAIPKRLVAKQKQKVSKVSK